MMKMTNFKKLITDAKAENKLEVAITVHNRKEFEELCRVSYAMNFERKNCRRVPKEIDHHNIATDIIVDLSSTSKIKKVKELINSL